MSTETKRTLRRESCDADPRGGGHEDGIRIRRRRKSATAGLQSAWKHTSAQTQHGEGLVVLLCSGALFASLLPSLAFIRTVIHGDSSICRTFNLRPSFLKFLSPFTSYLLGILLKYKKKCEGKHILFLLQWCKKYVENVAPHVLCRSKIYVFFSRYVSYTFLA
jgi:hypothetical protein